MVQTKPSNGKAPTTSRARLISEPTPSTTAVAAKGGAEQQHPQQEESASKLSAPDIVRKLSAAETSSNAVQNGTSQENPPSKTHPGKTSSLPPPPMQFRDPAPGPHPPPYHQHLLMQQHQAGQADIASRLAPGIYKTLVRQEIQEKGHSKLFFNSCVPIHNLGVCIKLVRVGSDKEE